MWDLDINTDTILHKNDVDHTNSPLFKQVKYLPGNSFTCKEHFALLNNETTPMESAIH